MCADIGVHFDVEVAQIGTPSSDATDGSLFTFGANGALSTCVGAGWIDAERSRPKSDTRILFAVSRDGGSTWRLRMYKAAQLFDVVADAAAATDDGAPQDLHVPSDTAAAFDQLLRRASLDVRAGDIILPIVSPKRVERTQGILFVG